MCTHTRHDADRLNEANDIRVDLLPIRHRVSFHLRRRSTRELCDFEAKWSSVDVNKLVST